MPKSRTQRINLGIKYRGTVLTYCSVLEKEIETFIMSYFVAEFEPKWYLMREVFLDRFHFDGKIAVLEVLIKKAVGNDFKKLHGKLFGELRYIKDERNKFAHYVQFVTDIPVDHITLISFRDGMDNIHYSPENFKLLTQRMDRCIIEVRKLTDKVHKFLPIQ